MRETSQARRLAAILLAVFAFAPVAEARVAAPPPQTRLAASLSSSGVARSGTGALVVDIATGGVVYAQNAGTPFVPASNEKLAVALAVLTELGPAFRIESEVLGEGSRAGRVWNGDLVLKGYGDPTLSRADLAALARQVRALGITRVAGDVVGDESFFDRRRTAAGWKPSYYKQQSAPLSALVVDGGKVRGRTVDNPTLAAATAFREALAAAGVRVAGRARTGRAARDATPLGRVVSERVARIVRGMNRKSDNFVAEILLKQLGARELGTGSTAAGARVVTRVLRHRGVPLAGVRIVDGSGLSRYNRLTARAVAALLLSAWSDPGIKRPFVASLAVAGVNGTLRYRMRQAPARGNVRAKTGTLRVSSTLSGYAGQRYVFSVLMNARPVPTWSARRAQDRFAQLLAAH